jgi:hypothetical protein
MNQTFLGVFILGLSMVLWKVTQNPFGWFALFLPGAFFVCLGLYKILRDRD